MGARWLNELSASLTGERERRRAPTSDSRARTTWLAATLSLVACMTPAGAQSPPGTGPAIIINATILAEPGAQTPIAIHVGPEASIAPKSYLRIRGLPNSAALSEGHAIAPGAWAVPLASLSMLRLLVPQGMATRSEISVSLVDVEGTVLHEVKTTLVVAAAATARKPAEPPATAPPVAPASPTQTNATPPAKELTEQFHAAVRLLAKGDELSETGNIALARLYYQRAAEMGIARGALALAASYDANELSRRKVIGVQPDAELARQWYERARELGEPEAAERLSRLGGR